MFLLGYYNSLHSAPVLQANKVIILEVYSQKIAKTVVLIMIFPTFNKVVCNDLPMHFSNKRCTN